MTTAEIVNINKPSTVTDGTTTKISGTLKNTSQTSEKLRFHITHYDKNWQQIVAASAPQTLAPGETKTFTVSPQIPVGGQNKFQAKIIDFYGTVTYARKEFIIVVNRIAPAPVIPTPTPVIPEPTPVIPEPTPELDIITHENVCIGEHIFKNKFINGVWVSKELIELNSSICGYIVPAPEPDTTPIPIPVIPEPTPYIPPITPVLEPDPIDDLAPTPEITTYVNKCVGEHLFKHKFINGIWAGKELIELNSSTCGYIVPDPEPDPESMPVIDQTLYIPPTPTQMPIDNNISVMLIAAVIGSMILMRR